jgi:hypothetical protein
VVVVGVMLSQVGIETLPLFLRIGVTGPKLSLISGDNDRGSLCDVQSEEKG